MEYTTTTEAMVAAPRTGPFMTKQELARRLNVCPRTINNYMSRGWLTYYRLGGLVVFQESDVAVLLQRLKNAPPVSGGSGQPSETE